MKKLLLLIGLSMSFSSFAFDPMDICHDNLSFDRDRIDCMEILRNGTVTENAARVCLGARHDSGVNDCLEASLNKSYSFGELDDCDRKRWDDDRTRCMRRKGSRSFRTSPSIASEQIITRDTTVSYDHNEYVTCYERPKTRLVEYTNERQARRGSNKVLGGLLAVVGGQILGDVTGNDNLGDAVSIVGAGFALYGAVEIADSREIMDCGRLTGILQLKA